jgi:hypothetical protein
MATGAPKAGDDQKVPLDDEAKRLELEKAKAEARKAIAEAQKATLAAQLPESETKPLEGKVDVGAGVGLVAQLLAYKLLTPAAATIAEAVKQHVSGKATQVLIVEDRALVATDWPFGALREQLKSHRETLEDAELMLKRALGKEPPPEEPPPEEFLFVPAIGAATAFVGAAATLVGMFRTDYSIASRDVKIGTTPLVAAVARQLLSSKIRVTVDQFGLLDENSVIIKRFWRTRKTRVDLERLSLELKNKKVQPADRRVEDLRAEWKSAYAAYEKALGEATTPPNLEELKNRASRLENELEQAETNAAPARSLVAQAESAIAQFDAFATTVVTSTKEGTYPPIVAAALREALHQSPQQMHVLYVAIEGSGGETVTRRSLFGRSGQVGFMGGAEVSYLLLETRRSKVIAAGTETLLGHLKYDLKKGETSSFARVDIDV